MKDLLQYVTNLEDWKKHSIGYIINHSETKFEGIIVSNYNSAIHYFYIDNVGTEGIEIKYEK